MKISIIGAGNVGATAAQIIATEDLADEIVLLDVREGVAEGKAMDIAQALVNAPKSWMHDTVVTGVTNNYDATDGSDIVIITSGVPRKPGMTREELVGVNSGVVKSVIENIKPHTTNKTIYIIVSNPMDTMTYLVHKLLPDVPSSRIIGMGGLLDSARFAYYIKKATGRFGKNSRITAHVVGGHGDATMVPLMSSAIIDGEYVTDIVTPEEADNIIASTMKGGATMTSLLGTSAWVAPAQAIAALVEMIVLNKHAICACSVLDKSYDVCIGKLVFIGRAGIIDDVRMSMNPREHEKFLASIDAVKKVNEAIVY